MAHIKPQWLVDAGLHFSDLGMYDRDNAAICGVAVKTIRRWRRLYQRRGIPRHGRAGTTDCFRCHGAALDADAYAHLLGLYLGDGHIVTTSKGVSRLSVFQDNRYPGLINECRDSMWAVRASGRVGLVPQGNCTRVVLWWKHWPCLFPQHGPGRKHERRIALEPWQDELVAAHPQPFLRGLFHSDGCRITNWTTRIVAGQPKRYEYPRYLFFNKSEDILGLCGQALDRLDIAYGRPTAYTISVARRAAVAALDTFVGPKY